MRDERFYYVVAYDISDNRRRARVARIIQNYGLRAQKSVFECHLTKALMRRLRQQVEPLLQPEDSLRIYFSCDNCWAKVEAIGGPPVPQRRTYLIA